MPLTLRAVVKSMTKVNSQEAKVRPLLISILIPARNRTGDLVCDACGRDSRWRYFRLSRNLSVEMSLTAGCRLTTGDAIIVPHSDLQDPPEVIPRLIAKWREGYDVVYGLSSIVAESLTTSDQRMRFRPIYVNDMHGNDVGGRVALQAKASLCIEDVTRLAKEVLDNDRSSESECS